MSAIRALLDHAIDYAGLFPPAGLGMREAIANYAAYRISRDAWALGRFVLPVTRLAEFAEAARPLLEGTDSSWRLSAIAGEDVRGDLDTVNQFNGAVTGAAVDCFEFRTGPLNRFREIAELGPCAFQRFGELSFAEPPEAHLAVMQSTLIGAKLRTGGVVPEAFPPAEALLGYLQAIIDRGVALKCTAGLHHALRGRYRLTYRPDSPEGMMYGYLNVMLAAVAIRTGIARDTIRAILLEDDASAFHITAHEVRWRNHAVGSPAIAVLRSEGSLAFGSCSFREPMEELAGIPTA